MGKFRQALKPEITTEELFIVKKMIEGDIDSFKYFFDKYYNDLCNFVNIYLHDKVLAEEIVQDIFVYLWGNKENLRINTSVKAYLFTASKLKSLNHLRDTRNQKRIIDQLGKSAASDTIDFDDSLVDTEEFRKILDAAIEQLPPKCKKIFLLSKKEELSNKEIAEQLGISVKTVENQMTVALKKLREYLLPYRGKIFLIFLYHFLS
ncbi:MAG TPA: RNA polymerase sigma-70 factor [Prolixibacteraceae bacterium]|nr:RNA polymerase sigma-70 factor [Prolixibacteraceae bacterium]HPR84494.1 RNA polymerase sigma-70 factor [Prolixibacteraceae bacterium]